MHLNLPLPSAVIKIEKLAPDQIDEVRRIEQEGMLEPWLPEDYLRLLQETDQWLALTASLVQAGPVERMIGTGLVRFLTSEMELCKLAVDREYRRLGVATMLLNAMFHAGRHRQCRACFLEVRPSNRGAIRFYERYGFRALSLRPDYYSNPRESALILGCEL